MYLIETHNCLMSQLLGSQWESPLDRNNCVTCTYIQLNFVQDGQGEGQDTEAMRCVPKVGREGFHTLAGRQRSEGV